MTISEVLHLDYETKAVLELKEVGLAAYVEHHMTDLWCASWCFDDGDIETWVPGVRVPARIIKHVNDGGKVVAHNAPFEVAVTNFIAHKKYGWPMLSLEQMECTMAMAYAMGLPGALDKLAAALGITERKDEEGYRIMLQYSRPKAMDLGRPIWHSDPEKVKKLFAYGKQDIRVEREVRKRMLPLSEAEKKVWILDQRINNRGVLVDIQACQKAMAIVEREAERLDQKMRELTGNQVASCTATAQLRGYLEYNGIKTDGVAKDDILSLLADPSLPERFREPLILRQQAGKSSTAKLKAYFLRANRDGRVRGTLQYHGGNTGRWAARGIQLQNIPRGYDDTDLIEAVFEAMHSGDGELIHLFYGPPLQVISNCLRSFLISSPGKILRWGDYNAVEARVTAWLAGEEHVLATFRKGEDIYVNTYAASFHVDKASVTKELRGLGKVQTLAFGFGGGVVAFQKMAQNHGIKKTDKEADRLKESWRSAHPHIVKYWAQLERAAFSAVRYPGQTFSAGAPGREVKYKVSGSFLWCLLPSKRVLCYPYPKIELVETAWKSKKDGITYMAECGTTKKWKRFTTYGGSLCENVTQAVARDLLVHSMGIAEDRGHTIVFHVHDELVTETPINFGSCKELEAIMEILPPWAEGLPIKAAAHEGKRYHK